MKQLFLLFVAVVLVGGGCSYKYNAEWDTKDRAGANGPATTSTESDRPACNMAGEERYEELPCCGGLVTATSTEGKSVCEKPNAQNCVPRGERALADKQCCPGSEPVALDHAFAVCGEPGTGYKPKVCMAEGETPFIDTPNCCAGLDPKQEGDKYVCRKI